MSTKMVSPAELQMRMQCSTPDIVGITIFADFWFLIRGFSGLISFTLQFSLKLYTQVSCCLKSKCYLGELLYGEVLLRRVVIW